MHSYKHTDYDDYFSKNNSIGGNLTIHYLCNSNSWLIDLDYDRNLTVAACMDHDDIMECSGKWSINFDGERSVLPTFKSGSCDVIYEQCADDGQVDNVCIYGFGEHDDDDEQLATENEYYYEYVAGEYTYFDCDNEGFPRFLRIRDNDGNYLNETWENMTMIGFDHDHNIFSVYQYNDSYHPELHYLTCPSLLIDLCDTFFNVWSNVSGGDHQWTRASAIRISRGGCKFPAADTKSFIEQNWPILLGVSLAIIVCCICILLLLLCMKRKIQILPNNKMFINTKHTIKQQLVVNMKQLHNINNQALPYQQASTYINKVALYQQTVFHHINKQQLHHIKNSRSTISTTSSSSISRTDSSSSL